jgi:hypothetical protein
LLLVAVAVVAVNMVVAVVLVDFKLEQEYL